MKLLEFRCKLFGSNGTNDWCLEDMNLNEHVNLVVGQNATGKSRVIHYLKAFIDIIRDNDVFEIWIANYSKSEWFCKLQEDNGDKINYSVSLDFKKHILITEEILTLNDNILLKRKKDKTEIFSFVTNKLLKINPPDNKLVLHIRRDKEEFPFFENIVKWSEQVEHYEFANEEAGKSPSFWFKKLNKASIEQLKGDFNQLGYRLNNIYIKKENFSDILYLKEEGLKKSLVEADLSQGMSRALELLTFLQYLLQLNETSVFLLDDLGEGLDYERATKLGKLLVEKLESSNIQFVATSNDYFLMNVVATKYWNILMREDDTVKSFNYTNSKKIFDDFTMSGLSNFYLFSSDFINLKQL